MFTQYTRRGGEMARTPVSRVRSPIPRTEPEYLILADAAEALNGKLYLMGGGWDSIFVRDISQRVAMGIACGVLIPYGETDEEHTLVLSIEDQDGGQVASPLTVKFKTGRPPTLERGAPMHLPFAIKAEYQLSGYGTFVVRATIDNRTDASRTTSFSARPVPGA
jgi:hypothetical protein